MRALIALGIVLFAAAAGLAAATPAEVQITIHNGRVSLVAKDATLGQILTEWAKVGQTTIVNGDVPGGPLTLQLTDVPEAQALDILLRALSGYVALQRATPVAGLSRFDHIIVMATVAAPVSGTASTTARSRFPQPIDPEAPEQDAPPVPFVREDYAADDEVNWNRGRDPLPQPLSVPFAREEYPEDDEVNWKHGPESAPQPPPVPFVREDYPADDEVNWNSQLAAGGVQGLPSPRNNPGMPTVPASVAVPGMPTPAPVPRQPTRPAVPPDEEVL